MADRDLKIVISAVNNAQTALKQAEAELQDVSSAMKTVQKSSESQTASVFKGVAVYDLFRTSVRQATAFLKDSIQESMNASRIMAQVETNVRNAGFSYDELAPKIKLASENALKLGFDDETAAQSLSKLLLVTKDFGQAQALTNLAMDLARNKNIDLETATRQVTLATQGNVKELKLLGIQLDENASTAENLKAMQDQLKDSAVDFANTSAGQLAILNEEWANVKQSIGDELMPVMMDFFKIIEDNKGTITGLAEGLAGVAKAAGFVAKGFVGFGKMVATGVSKTIEVGTEKVSFFTKMLNKVGLVSDEAVNKSEAYADSWEATTEAAAEDAVDLFNKTAPIPVVLEDMSKKLKEVKNVSSSAQKATKDLAEAVGNAGNEYKDFAKEADDALFDLAQTHKQTMSDIKSQISQVKQEMSALRKQYASDVAAINKSFQDTRVSDQMDIAGKIVANETRIADIQKELAGEVTDEQRAQLEKELADRKQSQIDNASFIMELSAQIAEVKRFNALSELDQEIETFNKKRSMAMEEYNTRLAEIKGEFDARMSALNSELKGLKQQQEDAKALYKEKKAFIEKLQADTEASNALFAKNAVKMTADQVKKEVAYYQQLAEAIKAARSANTGEFSRINKNLASIPKLASGGIVTRPTLAMIGEAGPEAVIPLSGRMANAGQGVSIVITGNSFMGREGIAEKIGNDIIKVLKQQMKL